MTVQLSGKKKSVKFLDKSANKKGPFENHEPIIEIQNLRQSMIKRDESTADHSNVHEIPKISQISSRMENKSQIDHL